MDWAKQHYCCLTTQETGSCRGRDLHQERLRLKRRGLGECHNKLPGQTPKYVHTNTQLPPQLTLSNTKLHGRPSGDLHESHSSTTHKSEDIKYGIPQWRTSSDIAAVRRSVRTSRDGDTVVVTWYGAQMKVSDKKSPLPVCRARWVSLRQSPSSWLSGLRAAFPLLPVKKKKKEKDLEQVVKEPKCQKLPGHNLESEHFTHDCW